MRSYPSEKKSLSQITDKLIFYKAFLSYAIVYISIFIIAFFRESYFDFSFLEQASFRGGDEPWLPSGLVAEPILGKHFFGDFYLPFRFVNEANPYFPENPFNNILPFGQIFYQILSWLRVTDAFYVYSFTALLVFAFGIKKTLLLSRNIGKAEANLLSAFILFFSFPVITALDRGANVLFVAGVICIAVTLLISEDFSRKNRIILIFLLSYSISAKIYLLPLLIFIWFFSSKRIAIETLLLTIFLNILFSYQFGGPLMVFRQLELSFKLSSASANPDLLFGSLSQSGLIAQFLQFLDAFPKSKLFITAIGFLPGLTLLCLIVYVCKILELKISFVLILALSCFQYMTPVSYVYTGVWASISIAILISARLHGLSENEKRIAPTLYLGLCTQLLPIHIVEQYRLLIPFFWFITICTVLWLAVTFRYHRNFQRKS